MKVKIIPSKIFKKHYKKRITKISLKKRFKERVKLFEANRSNSVIKDHKLTGKLKGKRAFSITGNIRLIYKELDRNTVQFLDIGTHSQVYGE